jgi:cell division transport system ATP-binding protein
VGAPIVQLQEANIFQNKQCILSQVDIEVQAGDFVFLIGKTGTGKSSLPIYPCKKGKAGL